MREPKSDYMIAERLALRTGITYQQALTAVQLFSRMFVNACVEKGQIALKGERAGTRQMNAAFYFKRFGWLRMQKHPVGHDFRAVCYFVISQEFDKMINPDKPPKYQHSRNKGRKR